MEQRTIKFRIWNPEEKKLIESGGTPMMLHSFFKYTARFNTQHNMPYQQFCGLLDKKGKEIYEGDIIKYNEDTVSISFGWGNDNEGYQKSYGWLFQHYFWSDTHKPRNGKVIMGHREDSNKEYEVIGNIYEHGHLLDHTDTKDKKESS